MGAMWSFITSQGRRLPVPPLPVTLGSDPSCELRLEAEQVLPRHARLSQGDGQSLHFEVLPGALVELDGWALTEGELRPGDDLLLGSLRVRLVWTGSGVEAQAPVQAPARKPNPEGSTRRPLDAPTTAQAGRDPRTPGPRRLGAAGPDARGRPGSAQTTQRGLLRADLSQLSLSTRCLLGSALLVVAALIVWAVQALVVSVT